MTPEEREISRLEREYIAAFVTGNGAWLERNVAEDSIHVTAEGAALTKDQLIAAVTSGSWRMSVVLPSEARIKVYGATAVASGRATVQGTRPGPDGQPAATAGDRRALHVWARYGAVWQLVASQVTPVAAAAP